MNFAFITVKLNEKNLAFAYYPTMTLDGESIPSVNLTVDTCISSVPKADRGVNEHLWFLVHPSESESNLEYHIVSMSRIEDDNCHKQYLTGGLLLHTSCAQG